MPRVNFNSEAMVQSQQPADVILHNGQVLTVDTYNSTRQAVAVLGELVQAVGSDQDILPMAGPNTTFVNLHGRTVIPGIIDIHAHMDREGLKQIYPSLKGARSIDDILNIIR